MTDLDRISAQALSDTIGAIYDCAIDPEGWRDAVRQVAELCESPMASIGVQDLKAAQLSCLFDYGYGNAFWEQYQKNIDLSPLTAAACLRAVGDVFTLEMACSDEELLESRYYSDVLKPFGYRDFIGCLALRTGGRVAYLHACRREVDPRYGQREIELFKLLSPHVCRAATISDMLDLRTLKSEMLEATLNGLAAGVYLTARDGRVVYMNATAERQVKIGNALRIVNNRLCPTDAKARAALANMIDEVARDEAGAHSGGHTLAIPEARGVGYVATLLPLERGRRQTFSAPFAASVAVFTQDPAEAPLFPGEAFARLYGLTGGELRVLLALTQGLNAKDAAEMLGLSEPTVRTHLQHVFSKTNTSRQTELLQLLQGSMPPTIAA